MSWRDDLQRVTLPDGRRLIGASFRGVTFFVESSDRSGGRRTVTHEFPLRDDPYVEDLGRRARSFSIEGYVVGDGYVRQRDDLLSALEDVAGPGELVHPYHGRRRAICESVRVRESIADGGMAVLSIEFAEAPAQGVVATEEPDLAEQVEESATAALAAAEVELVADFDVEGQPSFAIESLADHLDGVAEDLGAALSGITMTTQELAALTAEVELLRLEASSIVRDPAEAMAAFRGVILAIGDALTEEPRALLRALLDTYDLAELPLVEATTETRTRERANQEALSAALRRVLLVEAARVIPRVTYETHEDAVADRDELVALLDEQAAAAGDAAYPALVGLRARVLRAVPGDAALARVLTISRRVPVPSLLLSYQLYGSVEQEEDILARNRSRHPGFLSGSLRVLSDG